MASCAKNTIRKLVQHDGIPLHRPPDISRAWLETEYHHKRRDLQTLARERHINPAALATSWGIPVRGHGHDALAHLDLDPPPSPAIRAVATGHQGLDRLKTIVQIDGHDSIAGAAQDLPPSNHVRKPGWRSASSSQRLRSMFTTVAGEMTSWLVPILRWNRNGMAGLA